MIRKCGDQHGVLAVVEGTPFGFGEDDRRYMREEGRAYYFTHQPPAFGPAWKAVQPPGEDTVFLISE